MATVLQREKRIEIRIREEDKATLEKAASVFGLSLSAFMILNSIKAAQEGLASQRKITLSNSAWDSFMRALDHPHLPNKALSALAKRHKNS
jgi:uncharacterized protein (DUF1778 family)